MKKICVLIFFITVRVESVPLPVEARASMGLVGMGVFTDFNKDHSGIGAPSVGPIFMLSMPLLTMPQDSDSDQKTKQPRRVLSWGGIVFATISPVSNISDSTTYNFGLGPSIGFFDNSITVSLVYSAIIKIISGRSDVGSYAGLVFTSNSFNL